jgi:hypothetical protein
MLRRMALVRTVVSEELSAPFIRATRIGELGTSLAVTSNRRTLRRNMYMYVCINMCITLIILQLWGKEMKRDYMWGTRTRKVEYRCSKQQ